MTVSWFDWQTDLTHQAGLFQRVAASAMLDLDLKERVRAAVDIVDVIGTSLTLSPKGRMLAARCPWHDDRSPSLTVNKERQTWKCWVCDIGGDVFSFVMKREGVDFITALKMLADEAGIEYQVGPKAEPGSKDDKSTLLAAVQLVCKAYYDLLDSPASDDAKIARAYLEERGIDDQQRQKFQIGFSPDSWDFATNLLQQNKFRDEIGPAAGIALNRRGGGSYDLFRGRLMFPIHDSQGRPISMGGRVIPPIAARHGDKAGGKYINGPETILFRKSQQLYALDKSKEAIRKGGQALVMEGYTDVIAAHQAGIEPAVAVLGTALGEGHVKLLKRWTDRVVLVLDGDAAGRRRADEVLELFVKADADLRVLTLPDGMDPADYLAEHGRTAMEALIEQAPDALEHKLHSLTEGIDVTNDTHQVMSAIDTMTSILAKATKLDPIKLDQMMLRLSRTFGISKERLEERLKQKRVEQKERDQKAKRFRQTQQANQDKPNSASVQADQPSPQQQTTGSKPTRSKPSPSKSKPSFDDGNFDPNMLLNEAAEFDSDPGEMYFDDASYYSEVAEPSFDAPVSKPKPQKDIPLSSIDRELFEAMIESPDLAGRAVETIDPDWLDTYAAKMLLSAYQELDLDGRDLSADSLLLLLENDFLKNEVVSMQFRLARREGRSTLSAEQRFQSVLKQYHDREEKADKQRKIAQLESLSLDEEQELELLKQLFESAKTSQQLDR
ncbi:DNA primase [Stieleria sp. JC731]|uniref:DNA primase n=1 Tax=Pirellulaceae TaxID=2691357 RepID=UPI001E3B6B29|nr:DNA primase [Stieleria sp. JC731]MCC9602718.1 DNA primase [Stieleria sp. JC731]